MEDNEILKLINFLQPDEDLRGDSVIWANWMSQLTPTTCYYYIEQHGKKNSDTGNQKYL